MPNVSDLISSLLQHEKEFDLDDVVARLKADETPIIYNLNSLKLDDEQAIRIFDALKRNVSLSKLTLVNNKISHRCMSHLSDALRNNMRLQKLELSDNDAIGPVGCSELSRCLKKNETLIELIFDRCNIVSDGNDESIDVNGLINLSNGLRENVSIQYVSLNGNNLTDYGENLSGLSELISAVSINEFIIKLDLNDNFIGKSGAELIYNGLKANSTLQHLGLANNKLLSKGCEYIGKLLSKNTTIRYLNLQNNDLTENDNNIKGINVLFQSLQSKYYTFLSTLPTATVSKEQPQHSNGKCGGNSSLWSLDLKGNSFSALVIGNIHESLSYNVSLVTIHLDITKVMSQDTIHTIKTIQAKVRTNEYVRRILDQNDSLLSNVDDTTGQSILHQVVTAGSRLALQKLVHTLRDRKVNLSKLLDVPDNKNRMTVLHYAVLQRDIELVAPLLQYNADVNVADRNGNTALHMAVELNDLALACLLVEYGASLTILNRKRELPLDMTSSKSLRDDVILCASRSDVMIVTSSDVKELQLANAVASQLRSKPYNLSVIVEKNFSSSVLKGRGRHRSSLKLTGASSAAAGQFWSENIDSSHQDPITRFQKRLKYSSVVLFILGDISLHSPLCLKYLQHIYDCKPKYEKLIYIQADEKLDILSLPAQVELMIRQTPNDILNFCDYVKNEKVIKNTKNDNNSTTAAKFKSVNQHSMRQLTKAVGQLKVDQRLAVLRELYAHVGQDGELYKLRLLQQSDKPYVVIGHNNLHPEVAMAIYTELDAGGIAAWVENTPRQVLQEQGGSKTQLNPLDRSRSDVTCHVATDDKHTQLLLDAIKASAGLVLLLSRRSVNNPSIVQQFNKANEFGVPVLPVVLSDFDISAGMYGGGSQCVLKEKRLTTHLSLFDCPSIVFHTFHRDTASSAGGNAIKSSQHASKVRSELSDYIKRRANDLLPCDVDADDDEDEDDLPIARDEKQLDGNEEEYQMLTKEEIRVLNVSKRMYQNNIGFGSNISLLIDRVKHGFQVVHSINEHRKAVELETELLIQQEIKRKKKRNQTLIDIIEDQDGEEDGEPAGDAEESQFEHINGNRAIFRRHRMRHPSTILGKALSNDNVAQLKDEIQRLKTQLADKEKELSRSRGLNHDLYLCMSKYESNYRRLQMQLYPERQQEAIQVAKRRTTTIATVVKTEDGQQRVVPYEVAVKRRLRVLNSELLRVNECLEPVVQSSVIDDEHLSYKRKELVALLEKAISDLTREFACNTVQRVWRGYSARCSVHDQRVFNAACKIQKIFRAYRFRKSAWSW